MKDNEKLVLVYTGDEVTVARLRTNLEMKGIVPIIKDGFKQGLNAGFVGGVPSAVELYVLESAGQKAMEIVKDLIED